MPRPRKADLKAMAHRIALNRMDRIPTLVGPKPFITVPTEVEPVKVIICGTRDFDDYEFLAKKMDRATFWFDRVEVIIGSHGQRVERNFEYIDIGADGLGKRWAEWNWWTYKTFWADWDNEGRAAGPIRNTQMAKYTRPDGFCVAFWDGKSPGTADMIKKFKKYCDPSHLRVYRYS